MKKLINKDIQKKSDTDLVKMCKEYGDDILKTRFDMAGTGKDSGSKIRSLKKNIARVKTEIRSRELNNK